ncbi:MAG TPA: hypothetical protein VED17_04395 [Nitrososphaerales archaeon]|nr:hypothetical protein [Nitrososphaerales archaeon]
METTAEEAPVKVGKEKFAVYGIEVEIPADWRVEFNPKTTRRKADVVFQSPHGNRFFISWGPLEDARKKFKTLEEHRDYGIKRIQKGPDVRSSEVTDLVELQIGGHRALMSHVTAKLQRGMMSRGTSTREIWSIHFHCPNTSRYYVVYSMQRESDEFEDLSAIFRELAASMKCHPDSGTAPANFLGQQSYS